MDGYATYIRTEVRFYNEIVPLLLQAQGSSGVLQKYLPIVHHADYNLDGLVYRRIHHRQMPSNPHPFQLQMMMMTKVKRTNCSKKREVTSSSNLSHHLTDTFTIHPSSRINRYCVSLPWLNYMPRHGATYHSCKPYPIVCQMREDPINYNFAIHKSWRTWLPRGNTFVDNL